MDDIVVGFDGSEPSFIALDWVAERASRRASRVQIVRIDPGVIVEDDTDVQLFEQAERRVLDRAPSASVISRIIVGRMPDALIETARDAHLLVIGARRHRPFRSAVTGWRPLRTVSRSTVPTVVVPDDWEDAAGPVVIGIDDDDSSTTAIEFAAGEAEATGGDLVAVHAWQIPVPALDGSLPLPTSAIESKAEHRRILDDACERVTERHPALPVHKYLMQDNPIAALLKKATGSRMLVLGTHRRGIIEGALLGSTTQDTLPALPIPVCVVPTVPERAAVPDRVR